MVKLIPDRSLRQCSLLEDSVHIPKSTKPFISPLSFLSFISAFPQPSLTRLPCPLNRCIYIFIDYNHKHLHLLLFAIVRRYIFLCLFVLSSLITCKAMSYWPFLSNTVRWGSDITCPNPITALHSQKGCRPSSFPCDFLRCFIQLSDRTTSGVRLAVVNIELHDPLKCIIKQRAKLIL